MPPPHLYLAKLSHSFPLIVHLSFSGALLVMNLFFTLITHLLSGPVKNSWTLSVSLIHSTLRLIFQLHPPTSNHAFGLIRYLTRFLITPERNLQITPVEVALIDPLFNCIYRYFNETVPLKHIVRGEWVLSSTESSSIIYYIHGG